MSNAVSAAPARAATETDGTGRGVVRVRSEQDIVDAVVLASREGGGVRAIGARGSKNGCYRTRGVVLDMSDYDRLLAVDRSCVTVEAGITVDALNRKLAPRGLALTTPGEWGGATIAGALSTGTHGGSARHGIMSTSVRSLRLITAAGRRLELRAGSELFEHVGVSFGALGVISTVTLECVPHFHLEMRTRPIRFERYVQDHAKMAQDNEFLSAIWIPTARRVVTYAANRVSARTRGLPRPMRYSTHSVGAAYVSRRFGVDVVKDRWFAGTWVDEGPHIIAPIVVNKQRTPIIGRVTRHWREAEFAVPLECAPRVLASLDTLLARYPRALRAPVGLRTSAADRFSLSPCHGRDTLWVAVFHSVKDRSGFRTALRDFFEALPARCHWGKDIRLSPDHLRRQYPRWEAFRTARASLDPRGVFSNQFTRGIGL